MWIISVVLLSADEGSNGGTTQVYTTNLLSETSDAVKEGPSQPRDVESPTQAQKRPKLEQPTLKNFCSIFSTCAIHYVKNTGD